MPMDANPFSDEIFVRRVTESKSMSELMDQMPTFIESEINSELAKEIESDKTLSEQQISEKKENAKKAIDEVEKAKQNATDTKQTVNDFTKTYAKLFDWSINSKFPIEKTINSGLYITIYRTKGYRPEIPWVRDFTASMTPLDRAVHSLLIMKGIGPRKNLKIDQKSSLASYNGSTKINGASIDDAKIDLIINDIGFIYANNDKVVHVQLISIDNDGLETAIFLKSAMDSLLFTR